MKTLKWLFLLACFAFGIPLCIGVLWSFVSTTSGVGYVLFLTSLLAAAGYLLIALICIGIAIWQAFQRHWALVFAWAVIPAAISMFIAFPDTLRNLLSAADYIHFAAFSREYEAAVKAAPQTDGPRLLWFFWVDESPFSREVLAFLVFDESDEFSLPDIQRSEAWKTRALSTFTKAAGFDGGPQMPDNPHHLFGHYYVVHVEH